MDSDEAVAKALPALSEHSDLKKVEDPLLALGFKDGAGPYWFYVVTDPAVDNYVTVTIDALTGEIMGTK